MNYYLNETYFFDYSSDEIRSHLELAIHTSESLRDKVIHWYNYVRDTWVYDPHHIYLHKSQYRASAIANRKSAHCIDKSILFIAGMRAIGIPTRLHLAKVKNHISAERLIEKFGTDELAPHGYTSSYINDKWTKASPIFDKNLCKYLNVDTLEYNGSEDSIFQEFSKSGKKFMEYVEDYGAYADVPIEYIFEIMQTEYPTFKGNFSKVENPGSVFII